MAVLIGDFVLVLISIASFYILVKSADLIIDSLLNYSDKFRVSRYIIGFLVLSIGTDIPELITSLSAAFGKQSGFEKLVLGTLIGSSIVNLTLIVGATALIAGKIKIEGKLIKKTVYLVLALSLLPILLSIDGKLSRIDGLVLVAAYLFYIAVVWERGEKIEKLRKNVPLKQLWQDMFIFSGSFLTLLLSSKFLVISSLELARRLELSPYIMGVVILGLGSSLPDLSVSIKSVMEQASNLAYGDILGAVITNLTLIIGITSIISPMKFNPLIIINGSIFLIVSMLLSIIYINRKEVSWKEGLIMVLLYASFLAIERILI